MYYYRNTLKLALLSTFLVILRGSGRPAVHSPDEGSFSPNSKLVRVSQAIYPVAAKGRYLDAISLYRNAAREAKQAGDWQYAGKFFNNLGACQIAIFHYRDALNSLGEARSLSERAADKATLASADLNLSSLFLQMGNVADSIAAAEGGLEHLPPGTSPGDRAKLLVQLAIARGKQGRWSQSEALFGEGIDEAQRAADLRTAAWAWDYLGCQYRATGQLGRADRALTESFRLRSLHHLPDRESALWNLSMVRADEGDLSSARVLIDAAVNALKKPGALTPAWNIYRDRGQIKRRAGDWSGALADSRVALRLVRDWRVGLVPNDANRTTAESGLAEVYGSLIESGNDLALRDRNGELARETFEAAEENRAASLRALAPQANDWRSRLPGHYWEVLSRLQAAHKAALMDSGLGQAPALSSLRAELDGMEAKAGVPEPRIEGHALARTQQSLDRRTVLFSFYLGEPSSWLWAVTRDRIALYRLPARSVLTPLISSFSEAVRAGSPAALSEGEALYRQLFGSVDPVLAGLDRWLLALDEDLFAVPFPALVVEYAPGHATYLIEHHAIQVTSGAMMLTQRVPQSRDLFLAVGDPIYNFADRRFTGAPPARPNGFVPLARLWGTLDEIRSSAAAWRASSQILLTGAAASKPRFWQEVARHPSVIHLATHVIGAQTSSRTGYIVFSLEPGSGSQLLGSEEISAHRVASRLVVMSGCASGSGEVRAATGLMGLTRAWIAAGAGGVLAARWPIRDSRGSIFRNFYRFLRENPGKGVADALRQTQILEIHNNSSGSSPRDWAGYFLVQNY